MLRAIDSDCPNFVLIQLTPLQEGAKEKPASLGRFGARRRPLFGTKPIAFVLASFAFALFAAQTASANLDLIKEHVPDAQVVGKGRLTLLLWDMYDATLYAPQGKWDKDLPYALILSYLRSFTGSNISKTSAEEIGRLGDVDEQKLEYWHRQMADIFPDVDENTQLTGIRNSDGNALFYQDSNFLGRIDDPDFSHLFFAIWLDERTLVPRLRDDLLGTKTP